ncbi:hypothetical protein [Pseudophaeobacter flagellatus]|uniref:hypothetical protein n=1 Tax=Pseudophaeobacter flagellatus TaxID=2899119 RepID=UPI001E639792|nr:hypothetical protein [Pseudophaeobacter flagellatus]MCD9147337.1 hypothetical protein [Pseudophaeobacter flagellatus]
MRLGRHSIGTEAWWQWVWLGSATPKLLDDPQRYQALIEKMRPYIWEKGVAAHYVESDEVLRLLDYSSYFHLTKQVLPSTKDFILEKLEVEPRGFLARFTPGTVAAASVFPFPRIEHLQTDCAGFVQYTPATAVFVSAMFCWSD